MARKPNRQRKLEQKAARAARRHRQTSHQTTAGLSQGAARGLDEAEELYAQGEVEQAVELLEDLARRYPRQREIFVLLAEFRLRRNDRWGYQAACQQLVSVDRDNPIAWLALGTAALGNAQPAVARHAFGHVIDNWPNHPETPNVLPMKESLDEVLEVERRHRRLDEQIGWRVLLLHDEINLHLHRHQYEKVCEVARQLLSLCPTFAPALNNRSEAHFRSARYDEAIADSRRVLEFEPANCHAMANLTRYLYLAGEFAAARATAEALQEIPDDQPDAFVKKAESLAILGDWPAVVKIVEQGIDSLTDPEDAPKLAAHLAGVALANLGDLEGACRYWRRALAEPGSLAWARWNLQDSQRPTGQRHGAWAFPFNHWVPNGLIEGLRLPPSVRRPKQTAKLVDRYFAQHPQLELLASDLLERSDEKACEVLIRIAALTKRPAIVAAVKKFALGQRGSDDLRMDALMALQKEGSVEPQVQMWREGSLRPVKLLTQQISSEPTEQLPAEINAQMIAASAALNEHRAEDAEQMFDELMQLRPDDVSVQFNRAIAIAMQGREEEAMGIVRRIHHVHPDYIFARTHLAERCVEKGDLEQAKTLLAPISEKPRFHTSEYAAWCSANVNLAIAMGEYERARKFLDGWEQLQPDDPRVGIWTDRLRRAAEASEGRRVFID